jgi:hypothetical protein
MDVAAEDMIQAAAGPVAATFTFSRADVYLAQMAAFKPAASGPSASSLACNPTGLAPGDSTTCTVTLNQAAPAGGSTVTLSSNNTTALRSRPPARARHHEFDYATPPPARSPPKR